MDSINDTKAEVRLEVHMSFQHYFNYFTKIDKYHVAFKALLWSLLTLPCRTFGVCVAWKTH